VLTDRDLAAGIVSRARRRIADRYDWSSVAAATVDVYGHAVHEEAALAGTQRRPALRPQLHAAPILELGGMAG
jgi:hypothetical protein